MPRLPRPSSCLQLQQMAGMHSYGMPYGNGGMHSNMAFFGGGGLN